METAQNHQLLRPQDDSSYERQSSHTDGLNVLKIQRTCVHDGPGIRTTIFFRGCRLRCLWCQNPEALSFHPAPVPDENYSISDIIELVSRDKDYYHKTNGGVTLSGGDPLLQAPDTLMPLLESLRREIIHVAVETSLHVPRENIDKLAPCIDLFLVDLKVVGDDILHKKYTGQDSKIIRDNIGKLIALNARLKFRMLMVPGYNDSESHIAAAADFLKSVRHDSIELLRYHNLYEEKARRLGLASESLNITNDQSLACVKKPFYCTNRLASKPIAAIWILPGIKPFFPDVFMTYKTLSGRAAGVSVLKYPD